MRVFPTLHFPPTSHLTFPWSYGRSRWGFVVKKYVDGLSRL